jgi:tetratricopeptide (TPR) repeat protein
MTMATVRSSLTAALFGAVLFLSACESVEEKAESKYQSALELEKEGELQRAAVELRAVFKLNPEHLDARMLYAALAEQQDEVREAFGHYLLTAEQHPNHFPAYLNLTRLSIDLGAWDEAVRHSEQAVRLEPDNAALTPYLIAIDYSVATRNSDAAGQADAYARAEALLSTDPEEVLARHVILDGLVREGRFDDAMAQVDEALGLSPQDRQINQIKLSLLAQLEDMQGLGAHLKDMVERFPENREVRTALVRWFLTNNDADGAEKFVRELVARSGDEIPPRLALVQFLTQVRGVDAALAETDSLIEEGLDESRFRLLKATLLFDKGEQEEAIVQVTDLIEGKESSDDVRNMQTTLARMLLATGETQRAQDIVTAVLEEDAGDQNALKLHANWLIEQDRVRDAVLALRTALDQAPNDPETITLLARAYERGGNRELMSESLALAVEASNAAPTETLRYARFLLSDEKYLTAEDILLQSLRMAPTNMELLRSLAEVYLALNDLPRAEQVVSGLRALNTEEALALANGVQAAIYQRSARTDESIELMQSMIREGQSALVAQTAIIRTRLGNGEIVEARLFMNDLLAQTPDSSPDRLGVMFLNAALTASEGDFVGAREIYRGILGDDPTIEAVWRALIATSVRQGQQEEAYEIVDEALAAIPTSANLRWIKAGLAEQRGLIDEAISLYDELYLEDSNSTIIANNLASMITTYKNDQENLERAFAIARRLRGSDFPAFQDTYGWIAFRLGNFDDALEYLEPAANGLPQDPMVQYHLARLYAEIDRHDEALVQYDTALSLWQESAAPIADDAREFRAALIAEMEGVTSPEGAVAQ